MMDYKIRDLETKDIFAMSKILKKMELKTDSIKIDEKTTQEQVGIALVKLALENLHLAQDEVNNFLGDLVGLTGEEFNSLKITETIKIIKLFKEQEGLSDFLKSASL